MTTLRRIAPALLLPTLAVLTACGGQDQPQQNESEPTPVDTVEINVHDVGFQTPESVLYDPEADIYLVSNINGAPTDVDGNGFISRLNPDGTVAELKWIDGAKPGVDLDAPKGMALKGDTLFVADITLVRAFDRHTGAPLGSWEVTGSTFLNDVAVDSDGNVYVTDTGLNPDFSSSGTDAVYRLEDGQAVVVAEGDELAGPNGVTVNGDQLVIVSFAGPSIMTVPVMGGDIEPVIELPGGQLDGVVMLDDGSMLVSSWETSTVYYVPPLGEGEAVPVVEQVPSPADIGWDPVRHRVLIPIFQENRVVIHSVPGAG